MTSIRFAPAGAEACICTARLVSALPSKADTCGANRNVCLRANSGHADKITSSSCPRPELLNACHFRLSDHQALAPRVSRPASALFAPHSEWREGLDHAGRDWPAL